MKELVSEFRDDLPKFITVMDRNRLVLEIFGTRAKSTISRNQVSAAKIDYLRNHLAVGSNERIQALGDVRSGRLSMPGTEKES